MCPTLLCDVLGTFFYQKITNTKNIQNIEKLKHLYLHIHLHIKI